MNGTQITQTRARIASTGRDASNLSDEGIRKMVAERESWIAAAKAASPPIGLCHW
jgi:hypothetical protein